MRLKGDGSGWEKGEEPERTQGNTIKKEKIRNKMIRNGEGVNPR